MHHSGHYVSYEKVLNNYNDRLNSTKNSNNGFKWVLMCKWLQRVKSLSQQVFPRVTEELAFRNLYNKLGFYCQKMDDTRGSDFVMAHSQGFSEVVFLLDAQTSWVLTSTGLFFYWLALNLTVRTGTVGVCHLLSGTTVQFRCQAFVYFVLPTCLDHARGEQHMASGLYNKPVGYAIIMDLSRNVHMNRLYYKAYKHHLMDDIL